MNAPKNAELLEEYASATGGQRTALGKQILARMLPDGEEVALTHVVTLRKGDLAGYLRGQSIYEVLAKIEADGEAKLADDTYVVGTGSGLKLEGCGWGEFDGVVIQGLDRLTAVFGSVAGTTAATKDEKPAAEAVEAKPAAEIKKVRFIVDVSGSAILLQDHRDLLLGAMNAAIEQADHLGLSVAVDLFGMRCNGWDFGTPIDEILAQLPAAMMKEGAGVVSPGTDRLIGEGPGELIYYITDFEFHPDVQKAARERLTAAARAGATVFPIAAAVNGEHQMGRLGLKYLTVKRFSDLAQVISVSLGLVIAAAGEGE